MSAPRLIRLFSYSGAAEQETDPATRLVVLFFKKERKDWRETLVHDEEAFTVGSERMVTLEEYKRLHGLAASFGYTDVPVMALSLTGGVVEARTFLC